jgi:hypothetical protein
MMPLQPAFVRRSNADGTIDSICCRCFVTVTRAQFELDLERAEERHKCDPEALEYWTRAAELAEQN